LTFVQGPDDRGRRATAPVKKHRHRERGQRAEGSPPGEHLLGGEGHGVLHAVALHEELGSEGSVQIERYAQYVESVGRVLPLQPRQERHLLDAREAIAGEEVDQQDTAPVLFDAHSPAMQAPEGAAGRRGQAAAGRGHDGLRPGAASPKQQGACDDGRHGQTAGHGGSSHP